MVPPPVVDQLRAAAQLLPAARAADRLTAAVAAALGGAVDALDEPMRLAVTGRVKRGKSTLINALVRSEIAETEVEEKTADFHEYKFVATEEPSAPGRSPSRSRRDKAPLVTTVPADLPGGLRLIDTPGLGSPVNDTGGNAGLRAHCAVHLFDRNVHHEEDAGYLRELLARDRTQPLPTRVLGVLSACDRSWPPGPDRAEAADPLAYHPLRDYAGGIIRQIEDDPVNHELFYAVLPVAALVAEGGWTLTEDQIDLLADLAKSCDERALAGRLQSKSRFVDADLAGDQERRRVLVERIGQWGVHLACAYLRDPSATPDGLRSHLDEESGVARLRHAVVEHFVGRGTFIKLEQHLRWVEKVLNDARVQSRLSGDVMPEHLVEVGRRLERMRASSLGLDELALVELAHRHGHRLTPDEAAQLGELTGASGPTVMVRLGLPVDAGLREMLDRAVDRRRQWSRRAIALPTLVPAVVRTYERLIGRITQARSLLDSLD